jgi:L-asparaginase II
MPSEAANPVLVEATRGGIVESAHRGAYVVCKADGTVVDAAGDTARAVFPRSAIKVMQALPLVESGAADDLGLTEAELALACASHNGEPDHVRTAAAMLAKAGLDTSVLECGTHWPTLESAQHTLAAAGRLPSALHNNCSGKHAGFVCLAHALSGGGNSLRGFLSGYVQPTHPLMQQVTQAVAEVTGTALNDAVPGVDGCSIPTYPIPLHALARGMARLATGEGLAPERARAARRLMDAVAAHPFMVAGSGRFDTRVMARLGTRVFCKVGAEAVYCAAFREQGLGVAVKMDDGNTARAAEVAMASLIRRHVPLAGADAAPIDSLADVALVNWRGVEVGRLVGRSVAA